MMSLPRRALLLTTTALVGAAVCAVGAFAQDSGCVSAGDTLICSGSLNAGAVVQFANATVDGEAITNLLVEKLTRDLETPQNPTAVLLEWTGTAGSSGSGDGGAGGPAAGLNLRVDGSPIGITADGNFTGGVVTRATGGDGGSAGSERDSSSAWSGGSVVDVTVDGVIDDRGANAHGIFAQSASGATSGDTSGDVTIDANADVLARGTGGRAILAQRESAASDSGTAAASPLRSAVLQNAVVTAPSNESNGTIAVDVAARSAERSQPIRRSTSPPAAASSTPAASGCGRSATSTP